MANNRLYLACKACGAQLFLGKYYPHGGWGGPVAYGIRSIPEWANLYETFLHMHGTPEHFSNDTDIMWGADTFTLAYENTNSVSTAEAASHTPES